MAGATCVLQGTFATVACFGGHCAANARYNVVNAVRAVGYRLDINRNDHATCMNTFSVVRCLRLQYPGHEALEGLDCA